ncbi:MAG: ACT domain-containing protein [Planctomycetaceae bacterium]|nr:ACT domain-containing protein [Planctomycetaceae bacterium]
MPKEYIITMTAANRVGIMSAVTRAMSDLGADLREASQTVVRGYFTMIFSAEFPEKLDAGVIRDHLLDVCRPFGIDVNLKEPVPETGDETPRKTLRLYSLRLGGDNQPGVLRQLSTVISTKRIDIAGMHAVRVRRGSGFEMVMKIAVPPELDIDGLLAELNQIGQPFNMTADISDYS